MSPQDVDAPALAVADFARYSRQLVLPEFGARGQRRLASARVLVVGAGGLGSPVLLYLAAAGVGTIGILDSDTVEVSNLHRQVIHTTGSIGRSKVDSAADRVAALNPGVQVVRHLTRLDEANATDIVVGYDVVVDGADNFPTRYLVNDACAGAGIPVVWGSVLGFAAQVAVFWAAAPDGAGVDLRDLFPHPPAPGSVPNCAEAGVIGAVCGQAGAIMAGEVVKLVTGIGEPLLGRVLVIDALRGRWDEIPLRRSAGRSKPDRQPVPVVCGLATAPSDLARPGAGRGASRPSGTAPASAVQPADPVAPGVVHPGDFLLDVRTPEEFAQGHLAGAVNVPLQALLAGDGPEPPTDRPLLVICRSGARADVAAAALLARGFTDVRVLPGGMLALADTRR